MLIELSLELLTLELLELDVLALCELLELVLWLDVLLRLDRLDWLLELSEEVEDALLVDDGELDELPLLTELGLEEDAELVELNELLLDRLELEVLCELVEL